VVPATSKTITEGSSIFVGVEMQEDLAVKLLAKVLGWDTATVRTELRPLLHLGRLKYDQYQQFSPGMRFIESLALWLNQFDSGNERDVAFSMFRDLAVFISAAEMDHLVEMAYPDVLRPRIIRLAAKAEPSYRVRRIIQSENYKAIQARTLYVGLSDGAQTGLFRRYNPGVVEHEQTLLTYQSDDEKLEDLADHLRKSVSAVSPSAQEKDFTFRVVVLLDDFTASGLSFFRWDDKKQRHTGKLVKALEKLTGAYKDLMCPTGFEAFVCFYVATKDALERLQEELTAFVTDAPLPIGVQVVAVHTLPTSIRVDVETRQGLDELLRKYFDPEVVTRHWKIAKHDKGWLGYGECGLPLIISHNTPNNSLPILWFGDEYLFRGLFPRTSRHTT